MKRNVKFWTRYTWETMECVLVVAVAIAILALFGAEGLNGSLFASVVPYFLCIGAIFGMMLINTGSHTLYVPLLLSMGETRRNVFLGFQYYRILTIAVTTILCALIWLLIPGEVSSNGLHSLPTLFCTLVTASAVGSILGTIFVKWKWLGILFIILICGGLGGIAGATSVSMTRLSLTNTVELTAYLTGLPPWWLVLAALLLLALDLLFQWIILRRQEVRL